MRFVKQLIYGVLYLAILGAIGYGVYSSGIFVGPTCQDNRLNQQETEVDCGGPNCIPCALKRVQPLKSEVDVFPLGANTNAVIRLANPNLTYGAASFTYTLNFYDRNHNKISSTSKTSFIYPAQVEKVIVEPNLAANFRDISGQPELLIGDLDWKPEAEMKQPAIQIRQVNTQVSKNTATVTGLLVNREAFGLSEGEVSVVLYQKSGSHPVGLSKTVVTDLKPFEERAFSIQLPLSIALKAPDISTVITAEVRR